MDTYSSAESSKPHSTHRAYVLNEFDGNQVEDAQAHDAQAHDAQAQEGAQAQRITRSMARALGQEYQKMTLLISIV